MLAFFPWLDIEGPIEVDRWRVVPYQRARAPAGAESSEQGILDGVLKPFTRFGRSVNVATIIHGVGRGFADDLNEAERDELFILAKLISFSGLSAREYFMGGLGGYCNSSDFAFMIQGFRERPDGSVVDVRRRDGVTTIRITADAYTVMAPMHTSNNGISKRLEPELILSLWQARGHALWDQLDEAMTCFLRANSDSTEASEQSEVIDMAGAFEKALGVWGSRALRRKTRAHLRPTKNISPRDSPRVPPALRNGPDLRSIWMKDFYRLRNPHAHGSQKAPSDLIWDRREHLLLAAYVFPLLVKSLLAEAGLYRLSDEDQNKIDLFEWRARMKERLFGENDDGHSRWHDAHLAFISERAATELARRMAEWQKQGGEIT